MRVILSLRQKKEVEIQINATNLVSDLKNRVKDVCIKIILN